MNDMEKQMRELALEMFEIKEKIESAKRADLPDKIRDFAIKELNERYEDKYDQFHNLEISYNTEMYKINSAKLKEKYEARAAEKQKAFDDDIAETQKAFDDAIAETKKAFDDAIAEVQKRNNYILEFIKQDPSARVTYNRTNDLSYIDKMYGPQIDMFIRHQEEALKEPVVVNEEQVIEPVVGVSETVIPEVKNEEVSVGDVEPVQEPVEQTEENESANQDIDLKEPMTVEEGNIKEDTQKHGVSEKAQAENVLTQNGDYQSANEQAQSMTTDTSASDALNDMSEGNYDNTPEPRKAVASIKQAGKALIDAISKHKKGALIALGAIVLAVAVPPFRLAAVVGAGVALGSEIKKGRQGSSK